MRTAASGGRSKPVRVTGSKRASAVYRARPGVEAGHEAGVVDGGRDRGRLPGSRCGCGGCEMEEATERGGRFQSDERLLDVFDPDIILPTQHFAAIQRKKYPSGEHRLL